MPQFLTTIKTSAAIEDIIKKAKKQIVLISPYLKITKLLFLRLNDAAQKGIPITVVYGKSELRNEELVQLQSLKGINLLFLQDLHAKCYFNEQELIVTSMNMYEFSEKNNHEMGVLFSATTDKDIYDEAVAEAAVFVKNAIEKDKPMLKKSLSFPGFNEDNKVKYVDDFYQQADVSVRNRALQYENNLFVINKRYQTVSNFHFHSLYEHLGTEFPHCRKSIKQIDYGSGLVISIEDFPFQNIHLNVMDSIKFYFDDRWEYEQIKQCLKGSFEHLVPSAKFYWNYNDINILPADENLFQVTQDGLRAKVTHYLEIIKVVVEALSQ